MLWVWRALLWGSPVVWKRAGAIRWLKRISPVVFRPYCLLYPESDHEEWGSYHVMVEVQPLEVGLAQDVGTQLLALVVGGR